MELSPHSDLTSSKADVEAIEAANIEQATGPERVVPTGRHKDKAAELLDSVPGRIILTAAGRIIVVFYENLIWSFFLFCLPFIFFKPSTRQHWHTNLQGEEYSWLGSIVYVAQLIFQPLVAFLLVKLPIGKFTGVVVLGWGIVLSCMAIAHNFSGLLATRFFLGTMEASVGEHSSPRELNFER